MFRLRFPLGTIFRHRRAGPPLILMEMPEHEWPECWRPENTDREAALGELRLFLLKGVRSGLSGRPGSDKDLIEDVVQMALIRILESLDRFERRSAFTTWALAIRAAGRIFGTAAQALEQRLSGRTERERRFPAGRSRHLRQSIRVRCVQQSDLSGASANPHQTHRSPAECTAG